MKLKHNVMERNELYSLMSMMHLEVISSYFSFIARLH